MSFDRAELDEAFRTWVARLDLAAPPQWAQPDHPERWMAQASEAELGALIARAEAAGEPRPSGGLLVLVVGTSPQPCLLSALWHRPDRVVVAHSDDPVGSRYASLVEAALRCSSTAEVCAGVPFPATDPVAIFDALRDRLEAHDLDHPEDSDRTMIDVTGGKKPMVAAAYFLAAWRGIQAVYVDTAYDPVARLPRPCTADVVPLGDPGVALGLHALREADALWRAHAYRAAAELLRVAARNLGPHRSLEVEQARALADAIVQWEELAYDEAVQVAGGSLPDGVRALGAKWRQIRDGVKEPRDWQRTLWDEPWHLLLHLADVVHWSRRRAGGDHRAQYLRLRAAGEVAISLALANAWKRGDLGPTQPDGSKLEGFAEVWPSIRNDGAAKLLVNGGGDRKARWTTKPLPEASPWTDRARTAVRDVAAHGIAVVVADDVVGARAEVQDLLLAVAKRIGHATDPSGAEVDLGDAVATWLADGWNGLTPPAFPVRGA